jgi:hypothetical protein
LSNSKTITLRSLLPLSRNRLEKALKKASSEALANIYRDGVTEQRSAYKAFPGLGFDKFSAGLGYGTSRSQAHEKTDALEAVIDAIKLELLERGDLKLIEVASGSSSANSPLVANVQHSGKPGKPGRPRKDEERKRVKQLKDEGKAWKDIQSIMNKETGRDATEGSYRSLLRSSPK